MRADRYDRQRVLAEVGEDGQARLEQARVLCIGAGGLGCPALLYLAAAGVGRIDVVDHDTVDISNLHRQILFTEDDLGQLKARVAARRLQATNPHARIVAHETAFTDVTAPALLDGVDLVIDGTDNFAAKFLINDACVKFGKPLVYGAIQGFEGQIAVFNAALPDGGTGPCYRCLHPAPPRSRIQNCAEAGVIGAIAGMTGTLQAMEAIKLILGHERLVPLAGRLWMHDARSGQARSLAVPKRANCPVCSLATEEITLSYDAPICALVDVPEMECDRLEGMVCDLVDVREQDEWERGHIAGARHVPLSVLEQQPDAIGQGGKALVLYCQSGQRSRTAATLLIEAGMGDVFSLSGGYQAWLHLLSRRDG